MNVRIISCGSAAELLDQLRFRHSTWKVARYGDIAFRGQANESWKLVPSAFRPGVKLGYRERVVQGPLAQLREQCRGEFSALHEFLQLADRVGLRVPGDSQLFRSYDQLESILLESFESGTWPVSTVWETLAIAQHHGVPTRLLDFSYNPLVALFFAAKEAVKISAAGTGQVVPGRFAIWAVDLRFVRRTLEHNYLEEPIRIVTVPRASNQFLHAQHGLFLLDAHVNRRWTSAGPASIEDILIERAAYWSTRQGFWPSPAVKGSLLPPVTKVITPFSCALEALEMLYDDGITHAHLMPTYDGVVADLEFLRVLAPGSGHK